MKTIYLYLLEQMAEWEVGSVLQGFSMESMLKKGGKEFEIRTVSNHNKIIRTIGGLTLVPDCSIEEMKEDNIVALLLPGADTWNDQDNEVILKKAIAYLDKGIVVGAICGATLALSNLGVLNKYKHTSNSCEYLSIFSEQYEGKELYQNMNSFVDRNLVTANSASGLLWAKDIMQSLGIYSTKIIDLWYDYYATGNPEFYSQLLNELN